MKSQLLFVLTVISFFNPISVMANQMTGSELKGSPSVKCEAWKEKMLAQFATEQNKKTEESVKPSQSSQAN